VGEVEAEGKVLVIRRIKQTFHLAVPKEERETVERVLSVYADGCPVARSLKGSIEITSGLDFLST
jgi:organic hydroperoxide reductase OsmC/OhrA